MRIVIDHATRDEVRNRFGINNSDMTRILKYEYNNIVARRARAYILNFKSFHLIDG